MNSPENQLDDSRLPASFGRLVAKVVQKWPLESWGAAPMIVGVSGGADSVCLLRILDFIHRSHGAANRLVVAHVNHGMRGADSDMDQAFAAQLASRLGHDFETTKLSKVEGNVSEQQLRMARYQFFELVAAKVGARHVVTAHHADDQIETFLFRLMRGTSIQGAAGIPATRLLSEGLTLIRPLLNCFRYELLEGLQAIGQEFRQDISNDTNDYSRNRIRNVILPVLSREFGSLVPEKLKAFVDQVTEVHAWISSEADRAIIHCCTISGDSEVSIRVNLFRQLHPVLRRQVLVVLWDRLHWPRGDLSQNFWIRLSQSITGSNLEFEDRQIPGKIVVQRNHADDEFKIVRLK